MTLDFVEEPSAVDVQFAAQSVSLTTEPPELWAAEAQRTGSAKPLELTFTAPIKAEACTFTKSTRRVTLKIPKKRIKFWKNVVTKKDPRISVFWDKWVEFDSDDNETEDEEDGDDPAAESGVATPTPVGVAADSPHARVL